MADNYLEKKMERYLSNKQGAKGHNLRTITAYCSNISDINNFYINKLGAMSKNGYLLINWLNIQVRYEVLEAKNPQENRKHLDWNDVVINTISKHGIDIIIKKLENQHIKFSLTNNVLSFQDNGSIRYNILIP